MNTNHPVYKVLHPFIVEAQNSALTAAHEKIERIREGLAQVGNDLEIYAPYPNSIKDSKEFYIAKKAKHNFVVSITTSDREYSRKFNDHDIRYLDEEKCNRFLEEVKKIAALDYEAYIMKLIRKIGECDEAEITGNHVWSFSILTVKKSDGTTEKWKTHRILNHSKFGKNLQPVALPQSEVKSQTGAEEDLRSFLRRKEDDDSPRSSEALR